MPNKRKTKLIPLLGFLLFALILPGNAAASDLDIFNVVTEDVTPNVLLIIDVSGSMAYNDVWDASRNRYYTRLAIAKEVVEEIVRENPNVKWGLFTFPDSTTQSGKLVAPCMTRNTAQLNSFITQIKNLSATGGTPVSSALAEAGLYFAGQNSFFWTGTINGNPTRPYASPIENECQYNNIILMTDGFSSIDSGVKGGFTSTGTTKYDMASKNTIFLQTYMNGQIIGNYITRKTFAANASERIDLGSQLNRPEFIKSTLWTRTQNSEITGNLSVYTTGYSSINWARVESGSPTLGDTGLRLNGQLQSARASQLISAGTPYISGYNANDPSRPYPALTFTVSRSNTLLNLAQQGFLEGTQIYQGNHSGAGNYASDYLDDVAAFLNNEDLRIDMGNVGDKYEKQTVKTYTVGFMFSSDLLERTSIMGGAGPKDQGYFTAEDYEELKMAFSEIIRSIKEEMSIFVSPLLPSSGDNETNTGDHLYMGLFKPQEGFWIGNVKRYTLDADHTMNSYQDANGVIKSTAKSDWSNVVDGNDITKGGVAASLNTVLNSMVGVNNTESLRRIYTYIASNNEPRIAHSNNLFIENNSKLTVDRGRLLGFESTATDDQVKNAITNIRLTPMGAVLHSVPVIVRYPSQTMVFVGANDGFLHAFQDNNSSAPEAWAFVMPEHLATITKARTSTPSDGVYYVDGAITAKTIENATGSRKVLITGARRGGETFVALDISSYTDPKFLFQVPTLKETERGLWGNISLGQSWGTPKFVEVHDSVTGSGDSAVFNPYSITENGTFILIPGGYDTRYDTLAATDISSPLGAVIVGVNAVTGKPDDKFRQLNSSNDMSAMKHSVMDLLALDVSGDGLMDTIYYGDLGGNMFYATPYSLSRSGDIYTFEAQEEFVAYQLFKSPESSGRKFMYAPDSIKKSGIEYVFFGSGDRESPLDKLVQNRFYCVKNNDKSRLGTSRHSSNYLTVSDLTDVTNNLIQSGTDEQKTQAAIDLEASSGWYIDLREGEKVLASPLAFRTYIIFTTYQPLYDELADPSDVCQGGSSSGVARLYILDYLTGGAAMDRNNDGDISTSDRSVDIGTTIPSAPVLALYSTVDESTGITTTSAFVHVTVGNTAVDGTTGVGDRVFDLGDETTDPEIPPDPDPQGDMDVFFWREVY